MMTINHYKRSVYLLSIILGLFVVVSGKQSYAQALPSQNPTQCDQFFVNKKAPVTPYTDKQLCLSGYALGASNKSLGNAYAAEHLTKNNVEIAQTMRRFGSFDNRDPIIRGYRNSGYDRGHMAPSGDMPDYNRQIDTFRPENLIPQSRELNSGKWNWIEGKIRQLAIQYGEVYVVSGPYFKGNIRTIGDQKIWVPTATWKAIYIPKLNQAGVYFCKNTAKPTCHIISVTFFMQQTGIDPFPGLSQSIKEQKASLPRMQTKEGKRQR